MKLITAIAALALMAGSMDVEAQLIGKRKSSSQTNVSSETSNKSSNPEDLEEFEDFWPKR